MNKKNKTKTFPLDVMSISDIFIVNPATYEVPIYQRNFAWEYDEITEMINDVFNAYKIGSDKTYFLGTLVTYHKGDQVYEVIDGQQRLTTINFILAALKVPLQTKLTYRAR
ncbi:MAG: DUF262 domain-containing protein, partial [Deltaproteobacteria bacterium]|nr:DUF262 domain-containing protein [Deltaproteobacteria bacterium]